MGILAYYKQTAIRVVVSGIRHLLPKLDFLGNKTVRLDPDKFVWIRPANLGPVQEGDHYIHVVTKPSPKNKNAFDREGGGRSTPSENASQLRVAQVLALYDLQRAVRALRRLIQTRQKVTHRTIHEPLSEWQECIDRLTLLPPGQPARSEDTDLESPDTLLRQGKGLAALRFTTMPHSIRERLPEAKIDAFEQAGDEASLKRRIEDGIALVRCLMKARLAERQLSSGLRYVHRQTNKDDGRRPFDVTVDKSLLASAEFQTLTQLDLTEMVQVSMVSGVNCSEIWPNKHGSPDTFDFGRIFDLAVLIGQLERGQTVNLPPCMATFFVRELLEKGPYHQGAFAVAGTRASINILAQSLEASVGYATFEAIAEEIRKGQRHSMIEATSTH